MRFVDLINIINESVIIFSHLARFFNLFNLFVIFVCFCADFFVVWWQIASPKLLKR